MQNKRADEIGRCEALSLSVAGCHEFGIAGQMLTLFRHGAMVQAGAGSSPAISHAVGAEQSKQKHANGRVAKEPRLRRFNCLRKMRAARHA